MVLSARLVSTCAYEIVLEGRPGVVLNFNLFKAFPNKMPSFIDYENNTLGFEVSESWGSHSHSPFGGHYYKCIPTLKENDVFN